jgi:pimeloyl-ACP methyl ester carboxylesterase
VVGSEEVFVSQSPEGWILRGSGRFTPPIDLAIGSWEARYDSSWRPTELTVNLSSESRKWGVHTIIEGTSATSEVTQSGEAARQTATVAADTVLLPNLVFGTYEALAARLAASTPGSALRAFVAPQGEIAIRVDRVTDETIQVPGRTISARRWALKFENPGAPLDIEVWTEGPRLLRVDIPSQSLNIVRDDIASVSARVVSHARPNDEQISVPANGFGLAGTIARPLHPNAAAALGAPAASAGPARLPAVVLVSGSGGTDRDEVLAGIPIFGQLASALADSGFLVIRYDKRGIGQSGGRADNATMDDYGLDARAVVTYASKRKDVDPRRIALVGFGIEGGWISLAVSSKENRVSALALIGTAVTSGSDLVLEQQRQVLERSGVTGTAQQATVEQQKQVLEAVISGTGWEKVAPEVRKRVDTPFYRSFLTFNPPRVLGSTKQAVLVLQAGLDREVPPHHGEQLAQLARSRPKAGATEFVVLPGLNHLLARAETGEPAEYSRLTEPAVSPEAILEITNWLKKALAPPPPRK